MDVTLSEDEAERLRDLLRVYLPGLKYEVARTDTHDLRHLLVKRQNLCERLLVDLSREK